MIMERVPARACTDFPRLKRARIAAACKPCQQRKIRCSGNRPACKACLERGVNERDCIYQESPASQRNCIEQLENRINALEQERYPLEAGGLHGTSNNLVHQDGIQLPPTEPELGDARSGSQVTTIVELDDDNTSHQQPPNCSLSHFAIKRPYTSSANTDDLFHSQESSGHYEESVAPKYFELLRDVLETKQSRSAGLPSFGAHLESHKSSQPLSETSQFPEVDYLLPMHGAADHLLGIYWDEIHPFFPFVHRPSFQAQYDALWDRRASPQPRMFHCMVNTIFALSSQANPKLRLEARKSAAASYFTRAKLLMQFDIFEANSLAQAQALLLAAQYLNNTKATTEAWSVVGSAIRILEGLRLHQDGANSIAMTQCDKEMLRRIWHGCLLIDRLLSATLGLPPMLRTLSGQSVIPLPMAIDDEYLAVAADVQGVQASERTSNVHFFRHALMLSDILIDIINHCYSTATEREFMREVENHTRQEPQHMALVPYERQLNDYWASLPSHLQLSKNVIKPSETSLDRLFKSQAAVIRVRFLYTRTLLFRHMLAQHISQNEEQRLKDVEVDEISVEQSAIVRGAIICTTSAQEMISLIYDRLVQGSNLLPAYTNVGIFVHMAATVLLAARKWPAAGVQIESKDLEQAWQQAIIILQRSESLSFSAQHWIEHLQHLRRDSMAPQAQTPDGGLISHQVLPSTVALQHVHGSAATEPSFQVLSDEFEFHAGDFLGLEELEWNFLDPVPLLGH